MAFVRIGMACTVYKQGLVSVLFLGEVLLVKTDSTTALSAFTFVSDRHWKHKSIRDFD